MTPLKVNCKLYNPGCSTDRNLNSALSVSALSTNSLTLISWPDESTSLGSWNSNSRAFKTIWLIGSTTWNTNFKNKIICYDNWITELMIELWKIKNKILMFNTLLLPLKWHFHSHQRQVSPSQVWLWFHSGWVVHFLAAAQIHWRWEVPFYSWYLNNSHSDKSTGRKMCHLFTNQQVNTQRVEAYVQWNK